MSRSRKVPIIKDGYKNRTRDYQRIIRGAQSTYLRSHIADISNPDFVLDIPHPKTIVNDWMYCDWKFDYQNCIRHVWCYKYKKDGLKACKKCKSEKSRK